MVMAPPSAVRFTAVDWDATLPAMLRFGRVGSQTTADNAATFFNA